LGGMYWSIENILGGSSRPGHGVRFGDKKVPREPVDLWLADVRAQGIRSIICLLNGYQLGLYSPALDAEGGLIAYYRKSGFQATSIEVDEWKLPRLDDDELRRVLRAFHEMPKPVLVHCSAGVSRTGAALEHIYENITIAEPCAR
jgi:protein tyrosine/serine phosphatase